VAPDSNSFSALANMTRPAWLVAAAGSLVSIGPVSASNEQVSPDSKLIIDSQPRPDDVQYLEDRIYEFNSDATGIGDGAWLTLLVRDEQDRIVAGLSGATWGGCFEIRQFWVDESRRRQGLGTTLFKAAEEEARRRACRQILLSTFTFQAPAFYAKLGFDVIATIDDHPHGHQNLLLRKQLDEAC
jgi:GNAT superfamily N-acetyltransferase